MPSTSGNLLEVRGLTVTFATSAGTVTVVEDLDLSARPGETVGLVGESGSGKSVTSLAIMGLIPSPPGRITRGEVLFEDRDLLQLDGKEMSDVRGNEIAMIFQEPMTSLNPAFTIGNQIAESVRRHQSVGRRAARARAVEVLGLVGIPNPQRRVDDYPHTFSGGMRQRAMIAMALACEPKLVIADEPTTALDVTIQAQVLDLLRSLQEQLGMAMLFVTHDLGVVADICDRVSVMYAGQVVEEAGIDDLFESPNHPYTEGLLRSMPQVGRRGAPLAAIPGVVPPANRWPRGCRFHPRCTYCVPERCQQPVDLLAVADGRTVRCARADELALVGVEASDVEVAG